MQGGQITPASGNILPTCSAQLSADRCTGPQGTCSPPSAAVLFVGWLWQIEGIQRTHASALPSLQTGAQRSAQLAAVLSAEQGGKRAEGAAALPLISPSPALRQDVLCQCVFLLVRLTNITPEKAAVAPLQDGACAYPY